MKVQKITQPNYYQPKLTLKSNQQNNNISFEGLRPPKNIFATKKKPSVISKFGALATAAIVSMKELLFNNVLDISTVNQIKQNAIQFGEDIAENIYLNDGKFKQEEIEKLVITHLGEKDAKNIQVITNEDSFCDFAEKYMKLNREYAQSIFEKAEGLVAQGSNGKMMFLLKLEDKEPEQATNIATHEFEHLLYKTSGFVGKLIKQYLAEQSRQEAMGNPPVINNENVNKKFFKLQNSLAGLLIGIGATASPFEYAEQEPTIKGIIEMSPEVSSEEELDIKLDEYIKEEFTSTNNDNSAFAELQGFEIILRDEARAYEAGGKAQKHYNKLSGKNAGKTTMAEMVAVIYNRMADKIQEHKKICMKNSLKKSLGLKSAKE